MSSAMRILSVALCCVTALEHRKFSPVSQADSSGTHAGGMREEEHMNAAVWRRPHVHVAFLVLGKKQYCADAATVMKDITLRSARARKMTFYWVVDSKTSRCTRPNGTTGKAAHGGAVAGNTFETIFVNVEENPEAKNILKIFHKFARGPGKIYCWKLVSTHLFPNVDRLIFLDLDILVLGDLSDLQDEFDRAGESVPMLMVPESQPAYITERSGFNSSFPGFNGGVQLHNLKAMRELVTEKSLADWVQTISADARLYDPHSVFVRKHLSWTGDQGILSLYELYHRGSIRPLSFEWNYQLCDLFWKTSKVDLGEFQEALGYPQLQDNREPKLLHANCDIGSFKSVIRALQRRNVSLATSELKKLCESDRSPVRSIVCKVVNATLASFELSRGAEAS